MAARARRRRQRSNYNARFDTRLTAQFAQILALLSFLRTTRSIPSLLGRVFGYFKNIVFFFFFFEKEADEK